MEHLARIFKPRRKFIVIAAITVALVAVGVSLLRPLKYSASVRLLITQRAAFTLDPYTALRSTELVAENFVQLINTSSFLDRVLESGYQIDAGYFKKSSEARRRRLWENTIDSSISRGTGLLKVTAYHPEQNEAKKIVSAAAFLLSTQGSDYVGRDITVRLVDPPLASRFPVKPNLPLNMASGALLGALAASVLVWIDHRRKKRHSHHLG